MKTKILDLHWVILDFSKLGCNDGLSILTSDTPLYFLGCKLIKDNIELKEFPFLSDDLYILPISPWKVFIASKLEKSFIVNLYTSEKEQLEAINKLTVKSSSKVTGFEKETGKIFSINNKLESFIKKHWCPSQVAYSCNVEQQQLLSCPSINS